MQRQNFGNGRIISITASGKPKDFKVGDIYLPLTPPQSLIDEYEKLKTENPEQAGILFTTQYKDQLEIFVNNVRADATAQGVTPVELLPFQDGDTLCSWHRKEYTNYRKIVAPYLENLGYEVILN